MALPKLLPPQTIDMHAVANEGAERAVLGALIADGRRTIDVRATLRPDDMFILRHGLILQAAYAVHDAGKTVDLITLAAQLRSMNKLADVGGAAYLTELVGAAINPSGIEDHARLIVERAARRRLMTVARKTLEAAARPDTAVDILRVDLEIAIDAYSTREQGELIDPEEASALFLERIRRTQGMPAGVSGLSTGFYDIDDILDGFQPRSLNVVAARPGMGKTALAHAIALNVARAGHAVYVCSMEMSREQVMQRLISNMAEIPLRRQRRGLRPGGLISDEWMRVQACAGELARLPLYIEDVVGVTVPFIQARVERLARRRQRPALIIVDYLQLMRSVTRVDNRQLEVAAFARGLKDIAGELDIPVLALAQINRDVENRADRRPQLADLRESGEIEQAADTVAYLYHDATYNPSADPRKMEFIVRKNRHEGTGTAYLRWVAEHTRFSNATTQRQERGAL